MAFRIAVVMALAAAVLTASCGKSNLLPQSSLTLRNATTNALISTSENSGTINLNTGDSYPVLVIRTFTNESGSTESSDVTQFANFKWTTGAGICNVDPFGNVSAMMAGQAQMEVKFRASVFDPWDTVHLTIVVT